MNELCANVSKIQSIDNLNIVNFDFNGINLAMMSLGLSNVKVGSKVILSVNASNIAIAKDLQGLLSYSNQLNCTISEIEMGELLCSLELKISNSTINSLITASSAKRLNLKINDKVTALIKASELSIKEVL